MQSLGSELMSVYHNLSFEQQSEMIKAFQRLFDAETDDALRNFYSKLIELLEKEKKENV